MNATVRAFITRRLRLLLDQCSLMELSVFERMYSPRKLGRPLDEVIADIPVDKLDWALTQVENTVAKKAAAAASQAPPFTVDELIRDLAAEAEKRKRRRFWMRPDFATEEAVDEASRSAARMLAAVAALQRLALLEAGADV